MTEWFRRAFGVSSGLALAAVLALGLAAPAAATRGVAVDLQRIAVPAPLNPGTSVRLPVVTLRNPGDEEGDYRVTAGGIDNDGMLEPLDAWFVFEPRELRLDPAASQRLTVELNLPADAAPGAYRGLLRFELVAKGSGALVGAAAGVEISFLVADAAGAESGSLGNLIQAAAPWTLALVIAVAATAAAARIRRHPKLRVDSR